MKKIVLLLMLTITTVMVHAQNNPLADTLLLKQYYELKDALVAGDALTAAYRITDITNAGDRRITGATKKKLVSAGKELEKQRESFAILSLEMAALAKKEKLSAEPVYLAYCPMKKMYWLSKEPVIRNPYYGKAMLNCGSVTETIKP